MCRDLSCFWVFHCFLTPLFVLLGVNSKFKCLEELSHPLLLCRRVKTVIFISKITTTTKFPILYFASVGPHNTPCCQKRVKLLLFGISITTIAIHHAQKLVQVAINCLNCTTDPPGMFIYGVWMWVILPRVSLIVNGTLYANFGSRSMYFQFLISLFWVDLGTYFGWITNWQQKTLAETMS